MEELFEITVCLVAVIGISAPPFMWYVDRWLDATRAHIVEISKTEPGDSK